MKTYSYDLVAVGAGSGGYAAARTARDLGASVALVDHGPLGGLCILRGCMPSKTLIASSDRAHDVRAGGELGVEAGEPRIDLGAVYARKRRIVGGFADYRIESLGTFPIHAGPARFESATRVRVGDDVVLEAAHVVVGTGSVIAPALLPGLAEAGFVDSDDVLDGVGIPASIVVLGGGYVGAELGQFLARMGSRVTFLIRAAHLFSTEDGDVGGCVTDAFRADGIEVIADATLVRAERRGGQRVVHYVRDGLAGEVVADVIYNALGRRPAVGGLGLEAAGVAYDEVRGIAVDGELRTSAPNVYAVGDVNGLYPLVHVAIYQGEIAARNAILGTHERADYRLQSAHAIFTDPQVAVAGETEKSLTRKGVPFVSASYPYDDHGKAIAIGRTTGFVKMLAAPDTGEILGAAIVGAEASDLIHEVIVAMHYRATAQAFAAIPHLHPTLAEILTYPAEEIALAIGRGAALPPAMLAVTMPEPVSQQAPALEPAR